MEQKDLREWEARCIQEEPPACRAGCPLRVDGRGFSLAMAKNNMVAARVILEKSMPLAGIVARMCEAPCEQYCVRSSLGGSVAIGLLETVCVSNTPVKGKLLRLPARPKKVQIIGAGPSSLTVAFDLAKKGYPVSVYHLDETPGGWLNNVPDAVLSADIIKEEVQRLRTLGVTFIQAEHLDLSLYLPENADALYIGQDDSISPDLLALLTNLDPVTFALEKPSWFSGGTSLPEDTYRFISDVSSGREAAVSIDRFLQGASLTSSRVLLRHGATKLFTPTEHITPEQRIIPADSNGYTLDEAVQEAGRCIDCQCMVCVDHCVYLKEYKGYPKSYARFVYNNSAVVKGNHQANTFINSCSLCGQCEVLCPNDFSMADLCLESRQVMVQEDRMPPSAHWFALEEMYSARTEGALLHHAPGTSSSEILFYPGCQLAGMRSEQTLRLYDHLLEANPKTGIWLSCCGAPAHWAGREEEFAEIARELQHQWVAMGKPTVLTACSTCLKMFREHLPEVTVDSVWNILASQNLPQVTGGHPLALSDPCTSRDDTTTQDNVRTLLASMGQELSPLPMSGKLTECCGFGGLMDSANPGLARKVTEARVAQTDDPILTYCAMCRDQLARTGKPVLHILDLIFSDTAKSATEKPVSISMRRINRRSLKNDFLTRLPEEDLVPKEEWEKLVLDISAPVAEMMEERRILEDDIRKVLFQTGQTGSCFVLGESNNSIASACLGQVTFWVEYQKIDNAYQIKSCWSHRMTLSGGRS